MSRPPAAVLRPAFAIAGLPRRGALLRPTRSASAPKRSRGRSLPYRRTRSSRASAASPAPVAPRRVARSPQPPPAPPGCTARRTAAPRTTRHPPVGATTLPPRVQRRMHIGRPQVVRDPAEAAVPRLKRLHVAGQERRLGPDRPRHAGGEEQRVLLVGTRRHAAPRWRRVQAPPATAPVLAPARAGTISASL